MGHVSVKWPPSVHMIGPNIYSVFWIRFVAQILNTDLIGMEGIFVPGQMSKCTEARVL